MSRIAQAKDIPADKLERIALFLKRDDITIQNIAIRFGVSAGTVIRLNKKLGIRDYKGKRDLNFTLTNEHNQ